MKESRKISFIYSGITIGLVAIAGIVFYLFASHYTENLYYKYLNEKARVVAQEKFEKDEMEPAKYRNVVLHRQNSIPTSKELFINMIDRAKAFSQLHRYLTDDQIVRLCNNKMVNFKHGEEVGTSFIYYDNEGTFAVIVLSRNPYGTEVAVCIGWSVLLLVLVSAIILYLISRLYAIKVVDCIDKDYRTEKLFVNNASHEINNPLTAIQGECEVALMCNQSNEIYRSTLQRISQDTDRIVSIMHQLLQFSHTRSAKVDKETLDEVDIRDLMIQFTDCYTHIVNHGNFKVMAQVDLLLIAMRNLVNNARKYSGNGIVTITIDRGLVQIQDKGIGIPKAELKHIFEPFYRAQNASGVTGHGIGLALAKEILDKYGACIMVDSQEGKGTIFSIRFKIIK